MESSGSSSSWQHGSYITTQCLPHGSYITARCLPHKRVTLSHHAPAHTQPLSAVSGPYLDTSLDQTNQDH